MNTAWHRDVIRACVICVQCLFAGLCIFELSVINAEAISKVAGGTGSFAQKVVKSLKFSAWAPANEPAREGDAENEEEQGKGVAEVELFHYEYNPNFRS